MRYVVRPIDNSLLDQNSTLRAEVNRLRNDVMRIEGELARTGIALEEALERFRAILTRPESAEDE